MQQTGMDSNSISAAAITQQLADLFARDLTRLAQELAAFPDDASLWRTLPGITNAAGTLTLHLEGNLREYIGTLLGGIAYARDRDSEFASRGIAAAELVARVESVRELVVQVLPKVNAAQLSASFPKETWGMQLPSQQFLFHLFGHLNYHLGQIGYLRRALTGDGAIKLVQLGQPSAIA